MDRIVNGKGLGGRVEAIPSKSRAHRMLICAALADKESEIYCPSVNEDIEATASCLEALGAELRRSEGVFKVSPVDPGRAGGRADCGESGSTLRFLLPVACALDSNVEFTGRGRLPQRPLAELCEALRRGGGRLSADSLPIRAGGGLRAGEYFLPSGVSSQYISGLMFALPLTGGDCLIRLDGKPESEPYIRMTAETLKLFGVEVERRGNDYAVAGGSYRSPGRVSVEGDWSNAAFWLCAGAIGSAPVEVTGLDPASTQGDRAIVGLLERMGAKTEKSPDGVKVYPSRLQGIEIDAKDIPDLVPVLAVTAAMAEGETRIYGAGRLRIKESDRIASTAALLKALGGEAEEREDGLLIRGSGLRGGIADSFGDHRIAMAAAVASCGGAEDVEIKDSHVAAKSYPAFFDHMAALGGSVKEVGQ